MPDVQVQFVNDVLAPVKRLRFVSEKTGKAIADIFCDPNDFSFGDEIRWLDFQTADERLITEANALLAKGDNAGMSAKVREARQNLLDLAQRWITDRRNPDLTPLAIADMLSMQEFYDLLSFFANRPRGRFREQPVAASQPQSQTAASRSRKRRAARSA